MRPSLLNLLAVLASAIPLSAQPVVFEDVTREAGLISPLEGIMGHGGAFGDVDGDGFLDLYVGGFADRPAPEYAPASGPVANILLRNTGHGRFETWEQASVGFFARTSGAVFADLDNDGDADLYVANNCKGKASRDSEPQRTAQLTCSKLFRNDGGRLVDVSTASGACPDALGTARNIGVFDWDGDGLLDLFVIEDRFTKSPRSILFRNLGGLRFEDANHQAGLPDDIFGLGLAVSDLNSDGRPDFFVGHSNRLFVSDGDGKYTEPAALNVPFAWDPIDNEDWPCGAAFSDLNRDGLADLVLAIHGVSARNKIFLNVGGGPGQPVFRDVTAKTGLPDHWPEKTPHVEVQDFDNDGWPDLYFSTAWLDDQGMVTPLIYRHLGCDQPGGTPRFEASFDPKTMGKGKLVYYPAGPSGDFDNDGRIDLFLVNWFRGDHCRLLRNTSAPGNHWLRVRVEGKGFNRDGIGTEIRVFATGDGATGRSLLGRQELSTGYGYASGQDPSCHFGLGAIEVVDLEVRFPDGTTMIRKGVTDLDQILTLKP